MPTSRNRFFLQLYKQACGGLPGEMISAAGGKVYVAVNGAVQKASITDKDGTALTNPRSMTAGGCEFYCTSDTVDLYIQAPKGQWIVLKNFKTGVREVGVDVTSRRQLYVVPAAIGDTAAAAETDTGFDFPAKSMVGHTPSLDVNTLDAGQTLDVGTLSSESGGDADGFIAALSVATAALVKATVVNGGDKLGALLKVQDSANAGDDFPEEHVVTGAAAVSLTYTYNAGSDTAKCFINLPVTLCGDLE